MKKTRSTPVPAAALAILALAMTPGSAAVIFSDNFDGSGAAPLNGTTPDVTTGGATWVASSSSTRGNFYADGTLELVSGATSASRGGSATLAFTPEDGFLYTLDLSATGLNTTASHSTTPPLNFGFAEGQSTGTGSGVRMNPGSATVTGKAIQWFYVKPSYNGNNGDGDRSYNAGTYTTWSGWSSGHGGNIDMRILLDTSVPGSWTATWYAKRPAHADYTKTRDTEVLTDQTITSVGFSLTSFTSGQVTSFSLTAVPEPAGLPLVCVPLGLALLRRRRN